MNGEVQSTTDNISLLEDRNAKRRRLLTIGGVVLLVAILSAAAYVGGRLLNGQGLGQQAEGGGPSLSLGGPGGRKFSLNIEPAKELPTTEPEARGVFDHRDNNSIFVGTGQVQIMAKRDASGNVTTSSNHDGPVIEVVISPRTTIYQDVTMQQFDGPPPEGQAVQQVLQAGSAADIGSNSIIAVWGRKSGDRVLADILVFSPPAFKVGK